MKFITNIYEAFMAQKRMQRGTTRIINTTDLKKVMHYEVTDNVY
jgi:hypothetical protein